MAPRSMGKSNIHCSSKLKIVFKSSAKIVLRNDKLKSKVLKSKVASSNADFKDSLDKMLTLVLL